MNIYYIDFETENYDSGSAWIIAHNEEEAKKILNEEYKNSITIDEISIIPFKKGIITEYTDSY